ncbi:glycosyltransferase family 2 protein [Candidatus Symbiobacter mobilis]|uniref:Cell wall biogenesis glycosyltransferase n=1 Tax=Candidatus Symbiobacter mobilis CR TaxID=946483 RepID=U5N8K2_9BURK|nr:glycosyltransferase family 2 protein [Candidatus Symbiobacter mobilis]AGX87851.1 cell wall biogenesis glycosyltransferase [Candidatus Symbiobacter mobilis CR]
MQHPPDCAPVSVVVPCYRCSATIARAVASVAAQTLRPAELILVDDGSADATRACLYQVQTHYPPGWIRVLAFDENRGAASARNAGWNVATQPLVAFLDADDAWHPQKVAVQVDVLQAHPDVQIVGHGFRRVASPSLPQWPVEEQPTQRLQRWHVLAKNPFVTPSVMLRRDLPCRFHAGQRYMEDHLLWMQAACMGLPIARIPIALAAIYKRAFGVSGLSADLWPMERAELGNYRLLYRNGCLSWPAWVGLSGYSLLKFVRRVLLVALHPRWRR